MLFSVVVSDYPQVSKVDLRLFVGTYRLWLFWFFWYIKLCSGAFRVTCLQEYPSEAMALKTGSTEWSRWYVKILTHASLDGRFQQQTISCFDESPVNWSLILCAFGFAINCWFSKWSDTCCMLLVKLTSKTVSKFRSSNISSEDSCVCLANVRVCIFACQSILNC